MIKKPTEQEWIELGLKNPPVINSGGSDAVVENYVDSPVYWDYLDRLKHVVDFAEKEIPPRPLTMREMKRILRARTKRLKI